LAVKAQNRKYDDVASTYKSSPIVSLVGTACVMADGPDYAAFMQAQTDLRLAFHAAASLFHLRDWAASAQSIIPGKLQSDLEVRCEYFGLIRDVANAGKHLNLMNPSTPVSQAGDLQSGEIGTLSDTASARAVKSETRIGESNG
jgi:hypothetical protein